jgi:hypothetical protein
MSEGPAKFKANAWQMTLVGGLVAMLAGAIGAVCFADAAVSAVYPHGTGITLEACLFLASCGVFVVGTVAAAIGGIGWLLISD